jgi:hypothetical protein
MFPGVLNVHQSRHPSTTLNMELDLKFVMPALVAGIHVLNVLQDVDDRDEARP